MLYPRARVLVLILLGFFVRVMYIPAGFVLGFYFVIQLFQGTLSWGQGGGGGMAEWRQYLAALASIVFAPL